MPKISLLDRNKKKYFSTTEMFAEELLPKICISSHCVKRVLKKNLDKWRTKTKWQAFKKKKKNL